MRKFKPTKSPLRFGFFGPRDSEYAQRIVDGVIRYQETVLGCAVRDFRYDTKLLLDQSDWAKRQRPWEEWRADALVVYVGNEPYVWDWIAASGIPVVNTTSLPNPFPSVHLSFDGIARIAVEHFEQAGFANMAYLAFDSHNGRTDALKSRCKAKNLPLTVIDYGDNLWNWDEDAERRFANDSRLNQLLNDATKPLAILASNDNAARAVCSAAQRLGLRIPGDVGVMGVNNLIAARTCEPGLSSIDGPGDQVGFRAMEVLFGMMQGQPAPSRVEIDPGKVHARESTIGVLGKRAELAHAMKVMRDRACEGLSIEQILDELHVSRSSLYRACISTLGHTPAEEIARIRLERAKDMLANTSVPITEIGQRVGYTTSSNFTGFFKTQTGMTPRDFRNASRAANESAAIGV